MSWSYYPQIAVTNWVWALARSLATTGAITVVFSSSRYLDVSVPWVCFSPCGGFPTFSREGCPIRTSADQFVFANPRSFSQLITSFFAIESLGIPHTPLFTFFTAIRIATYAFVLVSLSHHVNELFVSF